MRGLGQTIGIMTTAGWLAATTMLALAAGPGAARAQTQGQMNAEAAGDFKVQDRKLNQVYAKLRSRLQPQAKQALETAERAWIAFRDDHCRFQSMGADGGSAHDMVYGECLAELTQARVKELEFQLTCEEGDLACVGWILRKDGA